MARSNKPTGPRQPFDPAPVLNTLHQLGLASHPAIQPRINIGLNTGNWYPLTNYLRLNSRLIDTAKNNLILDAQLAQIDPFHPRPTYLDFPGEIPIAAITHPLDKKKYLGFLNITRTDLHRHIAVFGSPGWGKTNAVISMIGMISRVMGDSVRFWIFEPKQSYRNYLHPDFTVLRFKDFLDETFEPPTPKISIFDWSNIMIQETATEDHFQTGSKDVLGRAIDRIMSQPGKEYPTHRDILAEARNQEKAAKAYREKEAATTIKLRFTSLVRFDDHSGPYKIPVSELLKHNLIFEWGQGETTEMLLLRTSRLISRLYYYKKNEPCDYTHVIVFEESRRHLRERSADFGEPVIETAATLSREMNIGFIFITQEPGSIARTFKSNVSTTIALPLKDRERSYVGQGLNLNPDQFKFYVTALPNHGPGHAIAEYAPIGRPFPVYFPELRQPPRVPDHELEKARLDLLEPYLVATQAPLFETQTTTTPKSDLSEHSILILRTLLESPFLMITELQEATGIEGSNWQKAFKPLEKGKYFTKVRCKTPTGSHGVFCHLEDIAYRVLGATKPTWGNEGIKHRLYKMYVAEAMQSQGYEVTQEAPTTVPGSGHTFDVLAIKDSEAIDFEITISPRTVENNIVKALADPRITRIVIVAENRTELKKCMAQANTIDPRLEFKLISDFFG